MKQQIKDFIYISSVLAILLLSVSLLDSFTGALVLNLNSSEENTTEGIIDTITSDLIEITTNNQSIENSTTDIEIVNNSIENVSVENVTNGSISESPQETIEVNVSTQNSTLEEPVVETNITEIPIKEPETNITLPEENITETPEPVQNVTQVPEINISTEATIVQEKVTQYQAVIGQPVKWKKTIKLDQEASNVEINLPKNVEITSVQKIENNQKIDITDEVVSPTSNILTGLFAITGFAVFEEPEATSLVIEQPVTEVEIEYETEAPQVVEQELSSISKIITVSSNTHYENILTFTEIPETKQGSINLYHLVNGTKVSYPITEYVDNNNNGKIDQIYWITPHLSNDSFQVDITILNVQSYPAVNSNWTVNFTTNGTANLTITPINGTTYGNNESYSLQFLELNCGSTILSPIFNGSAVFYQDYNCNFTGQHIVKVLSRGGHTLKFEFGNDTEYAYNLGGICDASTPCACGDVIIASKTLSGADPVTAGTCPPGNGLDINTSGITVNCGGNSIKGGSSGIGINFSRDANASTLTNCNISGFDAGVSLEYNATSNTINNNNISQNNLVGINVSHEANYTVLINNTVFRNGGATKGIGIFISSFNTSSAGDTVFNNTDVGFYVYNTSHVVIHSAFANESGIRDGILFDFVNRSNLSDIAARNNNRSGLRLANSSKFNIIETGSYEINIRSSFAGIEIDDNSTDNILQNNTIAHNIRGLVIGKTFTSENNTIWSNTFNNNSYANVIINNSLNNTVADEIFPTKTIFVNSTVGEINYTQNITINNTVRLISIINIANNSIFVNTSNVSTLNSSANLLFKGLNSTNPQAIVDTEGDGTFRVCSAPECNVLSFANGILIYNVSHFTNYSSNESPITTTTPPGPTGGGNPSRPWIPSVPTTPTTPTTPTQPTTPTTPTTQPTQPTQPAKQPVAVTKKNKNRNCWNSSGLTSSDFAALDAFLSTYGCGVKYELPIIAKFKDNLLNINLGEQAKIGIDFSERLPLFSLFFGEEGHLESPFSARYINWFWLIIAIICTIYLIKKEWKYLKEHEKQVQKISISEPIQEKVYKPKLNIISRIKALFRNIHPSITLPAIHLPKLHRKVKQKEAVLLEIEQQKKERISTIQKISKKHLDVTRKLEEARHSILTKLNLSESELSFIESKFRSKLPSMPELQPHPEVKEVPRHVNDTAQFNYLYEKIRNYITSGKLIEATRDYEALLLIYSRLIKEVANKEDLYNVTKSVHARLASAILIKRYGKLEDLNA